VSGRIEQVSVMGNVLYDFFPGAMITPYVGGGLGVGFVDANIQGCKMCLAMFAYQGILGVGYNATPALRISLEGRYYGTTNPGAYFNNNIMALLSVSYKFGQPEVAPPPPPPVVTPPSFMVFFDWDRSNLSQQALTTIQQAANAFKAKGNARITATGHTDTSGRRATTWRCRCVVPTRSRTPWCATACRPGDHGHRQGREPAAGADRRQRARAAEPPRRDRHPVRPRTDEKGGFGRLFFASSGSGFARARPFPGQAL
jgi:Outer membrane protein and related peptidoglycan-associated (lipo)proteins